IELPMDLPLVRADRQRIAQVLTNLVSNAIRYSAAGTVITVAARYTPGDAAVRFDIVDQGKGIQADDLPYIFEAFRRGSDERSRYSKGAGLGLAICKGLVEAHGGCIWIQNREGPGTTVSFTLPTAASV